LEYTGSNVKKLWPMATRIVTDIVLVFLAITQKCVEEISKTLTL